MAASYPSRLACDSNQKPSWLSCLLPLAFWDRVLQPNSAWLGTHSIAQVGLQRSAIPKLASSSCHSTLLPYPLRSGITNAPPCLVSSWIFSSQNFPHKTLFRNWEQVLCLLDWPSLADDLKPPNLFCVLCARLRLRKNLDSSRTHTPWRQTCLGLFSSFFF